jgi:hypothetical protein
MMALLANGSDSRFDLQNCPKRGASAAPQLLFLAFTTKIMIVGEQFLVEGGKFSVFSLQFRGRRRFSSPSFSDSFDSFDSWFTMFAFP